MSKIIGYKAPIDLFEGRIKKDTIYNNKSSTRGVYHPEKYLAGDNTFLPKEIVETWQPVYEKTQEELIAEIVKCFPNTIFEIESYYKETITKILEKYEIKEKI